MKKHRNRQNVTPTVNQTRDAMTQVQHRSRVDFWGDSFDPRRFDTLGLSKKKHGSEK